LVDDLDMLVRPEELEGMEVYPRNSSPAEFADFSGCGSIVVWTRVPPRRPWRGNGPPPPLKGLRFDRAAPKRGLRSTTRAPKGRWLAFQIPLARSAFPVFPFFVTR